MEYILAIGLTFVLSLAIIKFSIKRSIKSIKKIKYSQSHIYEKTRHFMPQHKHEESVMLSQSMRHVQEHMIKIIVIDNKAYWVKDNIFYTAETNNGTVIPETAKPVNTSDMSKKDIDKMLFILDNLGKGKSRDDSSSTGNE
jgi:tRNA splicing ligase